MDVSTPQLHFFAFMLVSLVVFVAILRVALRKRPLPPGLGAVAAVSFILVVLGMGFAKWGANAGLHWAFYYGLPAAVTILLPPLYFRMRGREIAEYVLMASVNAPVIHVVFSFFLGWHEYMPFIHVPSLQA
jgi:heme A synthase